MRDPFARAVSIYKYIIEKGNKQKVRVPELHRIGDSSVTDPHLLLTMFPHVTGHALRGDDACGPRCTSIT